MNVLSKLTIYKITAHLIAMFSILFSIAGCSKSQVSYSVFRGQVLDQNQKPVCKAKLVIIEQYQQTLKVPFLPDYSGKGGGFKLTSWYSERNLKSTTDEQGFFEIEGACYNNYFLKAVQKKGYSLNPDDNWVLLDICRYFSTETPQVVLITKIDD